MLAELFMPSFHHVSLGLEPVRGLLLSSRVHPTPTQPRPPPVPGRPPALLISLNICNWQLHPSPTPSSIPSCALKEKWGGGVNQPHKVLTGGARGSFSHYWRVFEDNLVSASSHWLKPVALRCNSQLIKGCPEH